MLEEEKIESFLAKLKEWTRAKRGIPFSEFHRSICKVQHASKGIPTVRALFPQINQVLVIWTEHKLVYIRSNSELYKAVEGFCILLQ